MRHWVIALTGIVCLLLPLSAAADVLLLKDGTYLEGSVVKETKTEVTVRTGGAVKRTVTVQKADIKRRVGGGATAAPKAHGNTTARKEAPGSFNPRKVEGKILFLLDVSGSMAIGERYPLAERELRRMVKDLPENVKFNVALFHSKSALLFGKEYLPASERVKKRLAKYLKNRMRKGIPRDRYTDLHQVLKLALAGHIATKTIVLFTDGIATTGLRSPEAVLASVKQMRGRIQDKKIKPRLFVRGVMVGAMNRKSAEDKRAARTFLSLLATQNGGGFAEVTGRIKLKAPLLKHVKKRSPEIIVQMYKSRSKIKSIRLAAKGFYPAFHLKVVDPMLAHGDFQIREYPAQLKVWVESWDRGGELQVDSPTEIPIRRTGRQGTILLSTKYLRVTGPVDNQEDHGSHVDKRVYLKAFTGGYLKIKYEREGRIFQKVVKISSTDPTEGD